MTHQDSEHSHHHQSSVVHSLRQVCSNPPQPAKPKAIIDLLSVTVVSTQFCINGIIHCIPFIVWLLSHNI